MKERPVLIYTIIITLLVELCFIVLVYQKIGGERLPSQIGRVILQLFLINMVVFNRSKTGLFLLAGYHIMTSVLSYSRNSSELYAQLLIAYHLIVGFVIWFHEWIEERLIKVKRDDG